MVSVGRARRLGLWAGAKTPVPAPGGSALGPLAHAVVVPRRPAFARPVLRILKFEPSQGCLCPVIPSAGAGHPVTTWQGSRVAPLVCTVLWPAVLSCLLSCFGCRVLSTLRVGQARLWCLVGCVCERRCPLTIVFSSAGVCQAVTPLQVGECPCRHSGSGCQLEH